MKCEICKTEIKIDKLDKYKGTFLKDEKGHKYFICANCQKKYVEKDVILDVLES